MLAAASSEQPFTSQVKDHLLEAAARHERPRQWRERVFFSIRSFHWWGTILAAALGVGRSKHSLHFFLAQWELWGHDIHGLEPVWMGEWGWSADVTLFRVRIPQTWSLLIQILLWTYVNTVYYYACVHLLCFMYDSLNRACASRISCHALLVLCFRGKTSIIYSTGLPFLKWQTSLKTHRECPIISFRISLFLTLVKAQCFAESAWWFCVCVVIFYLGTSILPFLHRG